MKKPALRAALPFLALCAAAALVVSCSRKASFGATQATAAYDNGAYSRTALAKEADMAEMETEGSGEAVAGERKLVRTGNVSVQVRDLSEAEAEAAAWCARHGGYVAESSRYETFLALTVRVPGGCFDEAMGDFSGMGKLLGRGVSTVDVTDRYYDLEGRIRTKEILYDRLQGYLREARNMEDLLSIERELNSVQSDLESMQGQFKRLSNQVDYSEISLTFRLPANTTEQGFRWPSLGSALGNFCASALSFFMGLLIVVLAIVVFGVPLVLLAALLYWLTFGRVGLVRRLFARLGRRKDP